MESVLVVVMGVAGAGKSTVAVEVARRVGGVFAEGDDFHSPENVAAMAAGRALTDWDRWPWLGSIRDWLAAQHAAGRPAVVSCSALARVYRDLLRDAGPVLFVHLTGSPELLAERIGGRAGHFMKADMLASQLATLEPLGPDEPGITIDVAAGLERIVDAAVGYLDGAADQASVVPNARPSK
ncbi:carbohydrate kinase, thermoresistant glucokinase family [Xylanimonas cellulosilytica DSM 15894]|uniref:Gluconokinase n=1 Tax=Xylanimonas cellulosilytica (strain DSM 15894 / JCM 12276 / CECT 5975 / KCTC 9989 / LMG 20990 / NBRC 107835 / XIL07) TaxID=446471 RepID=D1BU37_XYLCX|nr:gluconokinase [Xylanimonas cellulosilytica]ACZ29201.1 carbohydrate kinase, thermoresistant glucokinase family [Xylanimonas cellulosilytica DSM 15894]